MMICERSRRASCATGALTRRATCSATWPATCLCSRSRPPRRARRWRARRPPRRSRLPSAPSISSGSARCARLHSYICQPFASRSILRAPSTRESPHVLEDHPTPRVLYSTPYLMLSILYRLRFLKPSRTLTMASCSSVRDLATHNFSGYLNSFILV